MSMKNVCLILCVAFLFCIKSVYAVGDDYYEKECLQLIKSPKVRAMATYGKLRYDFSKDSEFLKEMTAKKYAAYNMSMPSGFSPTGLTSVQSGFKFNMDIKTISVSKGNICVYPESINTQIGYYLPTIYVLNSLEKDSCFYRLTVRHEKTHMQIYIDALDYFLPKFKKASDELFNEVGVAIIKQGENPKDVAQKLYDDYLKALQKKVKHWQSLVEREQMKMDSPEQYQLESMICEYVDLGEKNHLD